MTAEVAHRNHGDTNPSGTNASDTHRVGRHAYHIIDALNAEWALLTDRPAGSVEGWASRHAALTGCRAPGEVLSRVADQPDPVLHALLTEAARGDELAARVVLQAMLGKVVRLAARSREATSDDYVAALWCVIRTYPLTARPVRIAANLALDTLKTVRREVVGTRSAGAGDHAPLEQLEEGHPEDVRRSLLAHREALGRLDATVVLTRAERLGLLDQESRAVLVSVYRDGLSSREAATRHRTSPAMIRFRCSKAVRRLAQHASTLSEAA